MRDMIEPHGYAPSAGWRLEGRHVLMLFVGFFGIVFAVNGYMLMWALRTHSGVVSVEPYRKGLAYNARIAEGEQQAAIGWSDSASLDVSGRVAVRMTSNAGLPISDLQLAAVLGRPATERGDIALSFTEVTPGEYQALVGTVAAGNWMLTLQASHRSDPSIVYRAKRRLWLKP